MKDDYLWDKSGSDESVERMERQLSAFRCRLESPQDLKISDVARTQSGLATLVNLIRLASTWRIAVTAASSFVVIAAAALIVIRSLSFGEQNVVSPSGPGGDVVVSPVRLREGDPILPETRPGETTVRKGAPATIMIPTRAIAKRRPNNSANRRRGRDRGIVFTAEERSAYRQLVFALSLTGSKLKIVSDAVNGPDAVSALK